MARVVIPFYSERDFKKYNKQYSEFFKDNAESVYKMINNGKAVYEMREKLIDDAKDKNLAQYHALLSMVRQTKEAIEKKGGIGLDPKKIKFKVRPRVTLI